VAGVTHQLRIFRNGQIFLNIVENVTSGSIKYVVIHIVAELSNIKSIGTISMITAMYAVVGMTQLVLTRDVFKNFGYIANGIIHRVIVKVAASGKKNCVQIRNATV